MIIKTMAEFGKAFDEGKTIQIRGFGWIGWKDMTPNVLWDLQLLNDEWIKAGQMRTKPTITYYRVYKKHAMQVDECVQSSDEPFPKDPRSTPGIHVIFDHQVEED